MKAKYATFGLNRSVRVAEALLGDMTPILLTHETQFGPKETPEGITLTYNGLPFTYSHRDRATRRIIFKGNRPAVSHEHDRASDDGMAEARHSFVDSAPDVGFPE